MAIVGGEDMGFVYTQMVLITKENGVMVNIVEKAVCYIQIMMNTLETFKTVKSTDGAF